MTKRTFSLSFFFRKHIVAQYWWWHHHWFRQGHKQEMMSLQFYNCTKYQENLLWAQLEHSGEFVFVYFCIIVYFCVLLCIIVYYCVLLRPKKRILAACQDGIEPSLSLWRISDNQDWGAFSDCLTFAHNHHLSSFEPKYLQERIKIWWFLTFTPRYLHEWVERNFSHFDRSFRKIMWK